ncbi:MAG: hypothetical protein MZV64_42985 [Ignavibacteriales bacterium]|nr:hypothetical protein [Ignavibacteriales bacterium]
MRAALAGHPRVRDGARPLPGMGRRAAHPARHDVVGAARTSSRSTGAPPGRRPRSARPSSGRARAG